MFDQNNSYSDLRGNRKKAKTKMVRIAMNQHLTNREENIYQGYPTNIKNGIEIFKT